MKVKSVYTMMFAIALVAAPWRVYAAQPAPAAAGAPAADDASLYADGTRAINESRWQDAVGLFGKVADLRGEHAEGALYWKAYAQSKEGQAAAALETCAALRRLYANSRWIEECGALEIEIRGKSGDPVTPQTEPDENLKLLALNALMQQDQKQAIPILQRILAGNQSEELKKRALFVLAQNQSPEAQALIGQIARGQSGPELQIKAIQMVAAAKGQQSGDMLSDIYQHSSSTEVKKAILRSYVISGDSARLLAAARQESDPDLVHTAVQSLGAQGEGADLLTLYKANNNAEVKSAIINSLIAAGSRGIGPLTEIAATEPNADLRRRAIRNLGIAGGMSAAPSLVTTYQKSSDEETKRAAAQALFLANDAHDLIALARNEKDMEMKKYLVQQLSLMRSPEATEYMLEILNK